MAGLAGLCLICGNTAMSAVSGDLLTNSKQTSDWQNCDGSNLIDNSGNSFDPSILSAEGCVYRETPAISGEQYKLTCAVTSFEYSSMTLAFLDDSGQTLDTLTTEIKGVASGEVSSVILSAPTGATIAAVGVYGHPGSGFQGCTLLLDNSGSTPMDGSISGTTWFDENANSVRDSGESILSSTPVSLFLGDTQLDQVTTDKNGDYYFGGLDLDQCYRVHFSSPDPTVELVGSNGDNDAQADGFTTDICLDSTVPNVNGIDSGFVAVPAPLPPEDYAVCGTSWISDGGAISPLANVSVVLLNTDTDAKVDTLSGNAGGYAFSSLPAGNYQLYFVALDGYSFLTQGTALTTNGSYTDAAGVSPTFSLPADANNTQGEACTLREANAILQKTPVALDPTIANDDKITGLVGDSLRATILDNDAPCDGQASQIDLLGHNVPGTVSLADNGSDLTISDTTAAGNFSIDYGLRGACGSYDTAIVFVTLEDPPTPPAPAAPPAPSICQASVGKASGTEPGVHVDLKLANGETHDVFEDTYNFYDASMNLVYTGQRADAGVRNWGIFFRKREHGIEVFDVKFVTAVRNGVESPPTECLRKNVTPIAIDTDNSGRVDSIAGTFQFDIDADGVPDTLASWFSPSDAILIIKEYGDTITGQHLFGDTGGKFDHGFAKLAQLDIDGNGEVAGAELSPLALWFDRNSNALVDSGEVLSLESHSIVGLPVDHYGYAARARKADGSTLIMRDLWFPMLPIKQAGR